MHQQEGTRGSARGLIRSLVAALAVGLSGAAVAQTITVALHYNEASLEILRQCTADYEAANPGVDIVHQQLSYGDYLQTVLTSRIGGQSPDIYHVYSIWGPQFVGNSVLAEPPAEITEWLNETYVPSTLENAFIDGVLWGIPTEVSNYMLVYNKKLLGEAGFDAPPTTWAELTEMAAAITQRDAQGNLLQAGYAWGPTVANVTHPFLTLLSSRGVSLFADDRRSTNLTSPEAVEVLESMAELYRRGITDATIGTEDFNAGAVAMMIHASWLRATLQAAFGDAFEETVGVAPIPGGEEWRGLQYAFFYGVDANSRNQEAAWDYLRWLNSPQSAGEPSCMGQLLFDLGSLTGNTEDLAARPDLADDFYVGPFVAGLERSLPEPVVMNSSEIGGILRTWIQRAWLGELTPAAALQSADREITQVLREFY